METTILEEDGSFVSNLLDKHLEKQLTPTNLSGSKAINSVLIDPQDHNEHSSKGYAGSQEPIAYSSYNNNLGKITYLKGSKKQFTE